MNTEAVQTTIRSRRSCKPALMNGKKIDDALVLRLLELADWAPTHGHTEPWRFVVFANEAVQQFCNDHAALYQSNTPADRFEQAKYDKLLHNAALCSHLVVVYMKRGNNPKIKAIEEVCAVAAAVQNILLGASSLGIAALWGTGGLILHESMKTYFGLQAEDQVIGLLYLGYSDQPPKAGKRIVPLEQKIDWRR